MIFDQCVDFCYHQHNQDKEHFHRYQKLPCLVILMPGRGQLLILFCHYRLILLFLENHINGATWKITLFVSCCFSSAYF